MVDVYHLEQTFETNYTIFRLNPDNKNDRTWNNRILGFFDRLGILLGFMVQFDTKYYDLSWWSGSNLILTLSHEKDTTLEGIKTNTLKNIAFSTETKLAMVICYPESIEDQKHLVDYLTEETIEFKPDQLLIILDESNFLGKGHKTYSDTGNKQIYIIIPQEMVKTLSANGFNSISSTGIAISRFKSFNF